MLIHAIDRRASEKILRLVNRLRESVVNSINILYCLLYTSRLGFVDDVEIDVSCGRVVSLVVFMDDGKCFSIGKGEEVMVPWDRIERIGDDVILVSINIEECRVCGRGEGEREKKRRGFF